MFCSSFTIPGLVSSIVSLYCLDLASIASNACSRLYIVLIVELNLPWKKSLLDSSSSCFLTWEYCSSNVAPSLTIIFWPSIDVPIIDCNSTPAASLASLSLSSASACSSNSFVISCSRLAINIFWTDCSLYSFNALAMSSWLYFSSSRWPNLGGYLAIKVNIYSFLIPCCWLLL